MKEGWKMVKLKNICDKASSNVAQKDLDNNNGEYPIYGASGFIKKVDFFHYDKPYIGIVKDGSGVGRVNIYPANSSLLGTLQYIFPKNGYELGFIYYALQSLNLSKYKVGAAIPHIYFRDYGEKELFVPPLEEQHRIVSILDASFEKIDALKKNAEENLKNAKALFQQVLAQELKPKEGWVEKKLGEVYDVRDGTHDSPKYHSDGYPFVTSKNLVNGIIDMNNVQFISKEDYDKINERSKVDKGDVLFAMIGSNLGHPAIVDFEPYFAIKNVALFKVPSNQLNRYLLYLLSSDMIMDRMNKNSNGSSQPFVSLKFLRNFEISLPSLSEQHRIVQTLDALSEKCRRLETIAQQTIRECDALKQSILRQAFSGEL